MKMVSVDSMGGSSGSSASTGDYSSNGSSKQEGLDNYLRSFMEGLSQYMGGNFSMNDPSDMVGTPPSQNNGPKIIGARTVEQARADWLNNPIRKFSWKELNDPRNNFKRTLNGGMSMSRRYI